jgi:hypothetical protein
VGAGAAAAYSGLDPSEKARATFDAAVAIANRRPSPPPVANEPMTGPELIKATYGDVAATAFSNLTKSEQREAVYDAYLDLENRYPRPSKPAGGLPTDPMHLIRLAYPHYGPAFAMHYADLSKPEQELFLQNAAARFK